jgi:hypothetical protein
MPTNVVPFGKYKGQPVEALAADPSYVEWLAQQPWFRERYQPIYNVIINNFGAPSETPEHNAIQALFLEESFSLAFALVDGCDLIAARRRMRWSCSESLKRREERVKRSEERVSRLQEFCQPNWMDDVRWQQCREEQQQERRTVVAEIAVLELEIDEIRRWIATPTISIDECQAEFEKKGVDVYLTLALGVDQSPDWSPVDVLTYAIEIKPSLSDDYPAVLRQMRANKCSFLLLDSYVGVGVNTEQMVNIFRASGIHVLFLKNVQEMIPAAVRILDTGLQPDEPAER